MKILADRVAQDIDVMSNRGYLIDCIEEGVLSKDTLLDELLQYISEDDAKNIIETLDLPHTDFDEY